MTEDLKAKIIKAQRNEITDHVIYRKLSLTARIEEHRLVLEKISQEELKHYDFFCGLTREKVSPDSFKVFLYVFMARVFGLNFALRLLEGGEDLAQDGYDGLRQVSANLQEIIQEEERHESQLLDLIDEERLKYVSSMVLGLNDALVELTGALVGFTLALQNTRLVAIVGLITGIAASMSMAASEYLSTKQEDTKKSPLKASIYTGCAYVVTVIILVLPYFLFKNIFFCLGLVVFGALLIVFVFTFYISVAKSLAFKKRFLEMVGISLSIAAINFGIGLAIRKFFRIEG